MNAQRDLNQREPKFGLAFAAVAGDRNPLPQPAGDAANDGHNVLANDEKEELVTNGSVQ